MSDKYSSITIVFETDISNEMLDVYKQAFKLYSNIISVEGNISNPGAEYLVKTRLQNQLYKDITNLIYKDIKF